MDWLVAYLTAHGGTALTHELGQAADLEGIRYDALYRARRRLGLHVRRVPCRIGTGSRFRWTLPGTTAEAAS